MRKGWCTARYGRCGGCGKETFLSQHNLCIECAEGRLKRAVEEQRRKEGEIYERCREGVRMSLKKRGKKRKRGKPEVLDTWEKMIPEVPADKLIPLTKDILKLYEMQDQFSKRLDPRLYDWGSGVLAHHVLQGFYILADKTVELAGRLKKIIEFVEAREEELRRQRQSPQEYR